MYRRSLAIVFLCVGLSLGPTGFVELESRRIAAGVAGASGAGKE